MFIAVETADIVDATKLSNAQYKQVIETLKNELEHHSTYANSRFEVYRGDAYQVCYGSANHAFAGALLTRLRLMHCLEDKIIHLTQALVFGYDTLPSKDSALAMSMSDTFIDSGRLLDKTAHSELSIQGPDNVPELQLLQAYINYHLANLTRKQAQVVYYYIRDNFPEQQVIASRLNMTRQNVATHLKRGGAELLKHACEYFSAYGKDTTI